MIIDGIPVTGPSIFTKRTLFIPDAFEILNENLYPWALDVVFRNVVNYPVVRREPRRQGSSYSLFNGEPFGAT